MPYHSQSQRGTMNLNNKQNLFSIVMRGVRLLLAVIIMSPTSVFANPYGGDVVAGLANIGGSGSVVTVNQLTDRAIINWNGFSIDTGELTKFIQPNALSAILNRVTGGDPSAIYGTIQANGQVFLINPNGITVGAGGVINAQSFIASTLDVVVGQFMAGGDLLFSGSSMASVKNAGKINALGGDVMLIAHNLVNTGEINAANGTAAMAAGSEVLLKSAGQERVFVQAGNGTADVGVDQKGQILAAAAELKAAGGNVYGLAVNNEGVVRAEGVENRDGRVYLTATGGTVVNAGEISAKQGDKGGEVRVAADNIILKKDSLIDVSGQNGGGTALIGGDIHGTNPDMPNAKNTTVEAGAVIKADAIASGNGGKVVVWSDDTTNFQGNISAVGGAANGNGGFAEVSGKGTLVYNGLADLRAPNGETGTLLLDPYNLTIQLSGQTAYLDDTGNPDTYTSIGNDSVLTVANLVGQLALSNVLVQTVNAGGAQAGDITVASAITTWGPNSLTLTAHNNIYVNATITNTTGAGSLTLNAASGAGTINLSANITTTVGAQLYNGAVVLNQSEILASNNGNITFNSTINGADTSKLLTLSAGSGNVYLHGSVGAGTTLSQLTISGTGTTYLYGTAGSPIQIKTTGSQLYNNGSVSINTNNAELSSANQQILFSGAVNSPDGKGLTTSSYGDTTFSGAIGTGTPLDSLNVTVLGTGNINLNGGAIHTLNSQIYGGPVLITANDAYLYTVTGDINFGYSVGSPITVDSRTHKLLTAEVGTSGNVIFTGTVGAGANTLDRLIARSGTGVDDKIYINGTSVITARSQEYDGNVSIGFHDAFLTSNTEGITFQHLIDSSNDGSASKGYGLTTSSAFDTTFGGAVGSGTMGKLGFLSATITDSRYNIYINGAGVSTSGTAALTGTGSQDYDGNVVIGADATLTAAKGTNAGTGATLGAITFNHKVDGSKALTTTSYGNTTFTQAVGSVTPLAGLTVNTGGGVGKIYINGGSVATAGNSSYASGYDDGDQSYAGDVVLGYDTTVTAAGYDGDTDGGAVAFAQKVDGASANMQALTVNTGTTGMTTFVGAVGGTAALKSLETNAAGTTRISGGTVNTYGAQTYNDDVTLGANAILTAGTPGVIFKKTVNNAVSEGYASLKVAGNAEFDGTVGTANDSNYRLLTLEVTGTSTLGALSAISINTTQTQLYTGAVTLGNNATLESTGAGALGNITFTSTVNGTHNLIVNTSGITTFSAYVGNTTALTSLTTNAGGSTAINGGKTDTINTINTTGAQTYGDAVVLGNDTILSAGGAIEFTSTVNSAVNTTGSAISYGYGLTTNSTGATTFGGKVGRVGTSQLGYLSATASVINLYGGAIETLGNATATGNQDYNSPVLLGVSFASLIADKGTNAGAGGNISFDSTVNGARQLHIRALTGDVTFSGAVGNTAALLELYVAASLDTIHIDGGAVTTTGYQQYAQAVELGALVGLEYTTTLTSTGSGAITFFDTVNGSAADTQKLIVNTSGITTFGDYVGNTAALASLTTNAGGSTAINGGKTDTIDTIKTSGAQTYGDAVTLGADTQLASGGTIIFSNTVDSSQNSSISDVHTLTTGSTGATTFTGAVGSAGNSQLGSLDATATTININGGAVKTGLLGSAATGSQIYNGDVVLGYDTTLTAVDHDVTAAHAGGDITFMKKVDDNGVGAHRLLVTALTGDVTFSGAVGTTALKSLEVGAAPTTIHIDGGAVTTTEYQYYHQAVELGASEALGYNTTLTSLGVVADGVTTYGDIHFYSTVNGAGQNLIVNTGGLVNASGVTTFSGLVGNTAPLASLVTNAGGSTVISGLAVTTTGAQTYNDAVILGANAILTGSDVIFKNTLKSPFEPNTTLKVVGNAEFDDTVGAGTGSDYYLSTLWVTGTSLLKGGFIYTVTTQKYDGAAILDYATLTTLTGTKATFGSTLNSSTGHNYGLKVTGAAEFDGNVGTVYPATPDTRLSTLEVTRATTLGNDADISVNTTDSQTYGTAGDAGNSINAVTLGANTTLASGAAILFNGKVDSSKLNENTSDGHTLTTGSTGVTTFKGTVGASGSTELGSLAATATTINVDGGFVATSGNQTYTGAVVIGAATAFTAVAGTGGNIVFNNTVDSSSNGKNLLTTNSIGNTTFKDAVGGALNGEFGSLNATASGTGSVININGSSVETLGSASAKGSQYYHSNVVLGADATLTADDGTYATPGADAGEIRFMQKVDGAYKLATTSDGDTTFTQAVGYDHDLAALAVHITGTSTGRILFNGGTVETSGTTADTGTGSQSYNGNVELLANATLTAANGTHTAASATVGAITFLQKVDGAKALITTSDGDTTFNGAVGTAVTTPLAALAVNISDTGKLAGSKIHIDGLTIHTIGTSAATTGNGNQTYSGDVVLGYDTTLTAVGYDTGSSVYTGGNVTFANKVDALNLTDGGQALDVQANTGDVTFSGAVGTTSGTTALKSLTVDAAPGTIHIDGGAVTTTNYQHYNQAVVLGGTTTDNKTTLTSATGEIHFGSTVNGAKNLVVVSDGEKRFDGAVGGTTALASLDVDSAPGIIYINGGAVRTTGAQYYRDAVVLGASEGLSYTTTLTSLGVADVFGDIHFYSTVNGAGQNLIVNTGAITTFGGVVGGTAALASLITNIGGSTAINHGSVITTGLQTYNDAVILGDDTTLTSTASGAITFASTVNGLTDGTHVDNTNNHDLTVTTGGMTTFGGTVGATKKLDDITVTGTSTLGVGSAIAVNTSGTQTYTGPVTLVQNATLDSIGVAALGNITFTSAVDGAHNLIVNTAGITKFGGVVGGAASLTSLTTDVDGGSHGGTTETYGNVTTTAVQTYGDAVKLAKSEGLTTLTGTNVIFKSTLDSLTGNKSLRVAGNAEFDDVVGNTALSTLQITGTSFLNGGAVTTTSTQYYDGAVTLGKDTLLNTTDSAVTFTGTSATINGAHTLNIQAGNGPVTLGGAVGAGESGVLTSLTIGTALDGGHTHINGGAVKALTQTYNNATELGVNTTLTGNAAFKNTLNDNSAGNVSLTITGNAEFDGTVGTASGSANRLSTLGVTGNTIVGYDADISVNTTGTQTYGDEVTDAVTLAANTTLASGSAIFFNGTVDSSGDSASDGHTLTTGSTGTTLFGGAVGNGTYGKLGSLTVAASNIYLNGATVNTVATSGGNQTYSNAVTLGHDVTLSAGGAILFSSTVDSAVNTTDTPISYGYGLTSGSTGATTFSDTVGAGTNGELGYLSATASVINLNGGAIETLGNATATGNQDYHSAVLLGVKAAYLTANQGTYGTVGGAGGDIRFYSTVNGAQALDIRALTGDVTFSGEVGTATDAALTSLDVDNAVDTTYINGGAVKTTGTQIYNQRVILGDNTTLTASKVTFMKALDSVEAHKSLQVAGNAEFDGTVGTSNALVNRLSTLAVTGSTTLGNDGDISINTIGAQTYGDAAGDTVTLGANTTLASGGAILFTGTVDSSGDTSVSNGHTLTTGSASATTFNGAVGGGTYGELGSLSATASVINLNGLTVETKGTATATGNQLYAGDVVLQKATTLTAVDGAHATGAAAGAITFNGKVDGAFALVTTSDGDTTITHAVGYDTDGELTALTINISADGMTNGRTINLNGGTIEAAAQYYNGDVELGADTFLTGTSLALNAAKYFDGNGYDLTLTFGSGVTIPTLATVFANVKNFTSNGSGGTTINARTFTTTGTQTYGNAVILGGNATLVSTGEGALGNIGFASTVNGVYTLTVNTGGITTFGDAVGNTGILVSLTTNAAGSTAINGGSIHTSGAQTYNDAVTLDGNTVLTGSNVIFKSTLNDASAGYDNASLQVAGNAEFDGIVGTDNTSGNRLSTLEVTGTTTFGYLTSIAINTTGNQTYLGAVTLKRDALLNSADGITFDSTVASYNSNGHDLTTYSYGDTTFNGNIGSVGHELGNLTAEIASEGDGAIYLNGSEGVIDVMTHNDQEYIGQVYLGGNATLTASVGGIMFDGAVDSDGATPYDLTTHSFLDTSFNGNVGYDHELYNLMAEITSTGVNAGRIHLSGTAGTISVDTSGNQEYDGNVHLGGDASLTSTERAITFDGTVNSYNHYDLTTDSDRDTTFWGAVGDAYTLGDLSVTTGKTEGVGHATGLIVLRGGEVSTNGDQYYDGGVILGADTVMTASEPITHLAGYPYGTPSASTGQITFLKTVDSEWNNYHTLTTVSAGDTTFSDLVGDAEYSDLGVSYFGVLGALSVTSGDHINLDTVSVKTTGAQSYSGDVELGYYDTTLTTEDSDIVFAGTLNGFQDLTLETGAGDITLGTVGNTESLQSLTMNYGAGSGILTLNGDITSWHAQDYERDVIIGNNITLDSTQENIPAEGNHILGITADGDIHFHGTVDGDGGNSGLTLISGIGDVFMDGAIGDGTALSSLTIDGTGTTSLSGRYVVTTGAQTYNQDVNFYDHTYFVTDGGAITFAGALTGLHEYTAPGYIPQIADLSHILYIDAYYGDVTLGGPVTASAVMIFGNKVTWNDDITGTDFVGMIGTDLVMNGNINSTGLADDMYGGAAVMLAADGTFKNAASHTINLAEGARYLIYSVNPALDIRGGLEGSTQYSTTLWDGPDPAFSGNGFLYSMALDVPTIVDEQSFQATNSYTTFDVPEPGAGTHGGGFFSVINTPTNTNVYRREHRGPKNDQQQDDEKKKKEEARASVNKNSVSRAGGRLGPAFASLPGFSADAGAHSLLRSNQ